MEKKLTRSRRETGRALRTDGQAGEQFSKLLERKGTTRNDIERDDAGLRIIGGWEQLVKTTASESNKEEVGGLQQLNGGMRM